MVSEMELETLNGFSVIARAFDRNGQMIILAVRNRGEDGTGIEFEYVNATMGNRGDRFWHHGRYSNSWLSAFSDFQQRVAE
jgi:hypothetical protein